MAFAKGRLLLLVLCALIIFLLPLASSLQRSKRQNDDGSEDPMEKILNDPNHPGYIEANWNFTDQKWGQLVEQVMKKLMPIVIRSSSGIEISGPCMAALFKMMLALRQGKIWAYRLADAWAKPGGGMFVGTLGAVGDYDECVNTVIPDLKDPDGNFQTGKYCLADYTPLLPPKPQLYTLFHKIKELENIVNKNNSFAESAKKAHWFYLLKVRMGVCMPSACTREDVHNIVSEIPKSMNVKGNLNVPNCETKQSLELDPPKIAILSVLGFVGLLIFSGTVLDVATRLCQGDDLEPLSITRKLPYRVLVCFSAYTNFRKLINVDSTSNSHLSSISGIRFITVTWVIVGHSYLYADYNLMKQADRLAELPPNLAFQVVANSMLTVDTFIFISGLLVTYSVIKAQEKRRGLNVPMYIFHRIWRLTPPYMMTIALLILSPILGSGPVWKVYLDPLIENCKANWWTNLLYVNNYVNAYDFCLEHTWYLGVDMQLHILGLVVLLPLIRWPKVAAFLAVLLGVGFSAVAGIVNFILDLPPSPLGLFPDPDDRKYVEVPNYFKPYGHVGPYILGMGLGYLLIKKPKIRIPRGWLIFGWLFFSTTTLADLYGAYPWNNGAVPGPIISTLYAAISKSVWAMGIFWLVLVCTTGNGGIVNDILSWKAWIPLSRISYVFYLIHPLVIWVHEAFGHERMYTSHYFWLYNILGHFMISLAVALVVSLAFEAPFLALEKIIFHSGGDREKSSKSYGLNKAVELPHYNSDMKSTQYKTAENAIHYNGRELPRENNHIQMTNGNVYRKGGDGHYQVVRENGSNHTHNNSDAFRSVGNGVLHQSGRESGNTYRKVEAGNGGTSCRL